MKKVVELLNEEATENFGKKVAKQCFRGFCIYLLGDLGAGKTTFTRGFLRGLNHDGYVKSPTYTLVECYELDKFNVNHFDLYRLGDPEELEFIGIRDYFDNTNVNIVEWPQKGGEFLPQADIIIEFFYINQSRKVEITSLSENGNVLVDNLA